LAHRANIPKCAGCDNRIERRPALSGPLRSTRS
jgi:hypothetical protein